MIPRISTPRQEGQFQAAKWLKVQALLDVEELSSLLALAKDSLLYPLAGLFSLSDLPLPKELFLSDYGSWIEGLKNGQIPPDAELRKYSALAWTCNLDSLWLQEVPGNRYLVKPCEPLVQIQVHQMGYSAVDGEFRPMILSRDSIFWGLQFSFPQIYQSAKTGELLQVEEGPNLELFQQIRRWMRDATVATPMLVEKVRKNLPIRLGKKCFSWINLHPQLREKKLSVLELTHVR